MANLFSALNRSKILSELRSVPFDILVIGGGITGAGIALDASARGLRVALAEKKDFAFGTSSRSTKLIHGGLRYLKQLEFGLVKEVGSERAVVHFLAPHLVIPEKMLLPLSDKKSVGYWMASIGLKLYDWLAGVRKEDRRLMLTRQKTLRAEPLLREEFVNGGALYAEYRTDDARLTLEIIKTGFEYGALPLSYLRITEFIYADNKITGARVMDVLTGELLSIQARVVVNAAGPWVDEVRDFDKSKKRKRLHLTKGVHIVVAREKLPVQQAIYFDVPDGRMIFAIPRGRVTYIGTTDTDYAGDKDSVTITKSDVDYLLQAVNNTFKGIHLTVESIESAWAGLRPLIYEEGKAASDLSRKDEIFESPSGLISIAGGKLTGYRKMAERVVNLVIKKHFQTYRLKECQTYKIKLSRNPFLSFKDVMEYENTVYERLKSFGFSHSTSQYLVHTYGYQTNEILDYYDKNYLSVKDAELALLQSELRFSVHHEMVTTLADFFVRRTALIYFDIEKVQKYKKVIATELGELLGWTAANVQHELKQLENVIFESTHFG